MKKVIPWNIRKYGSLIFSLEFVLVEVTSVLLIFGAFFSVFKFGNNIHAADYQYTLGVSVSDHVVNVSISPTTVSPDLVLIIRNTNDGSVAYDSRGLGSGVSSKQVSLPDSGNYEVHLVWFISDVAAPRAFSIAATPPPSQWTLNNPTVSNSTVIFTFSPASNGNVGLWIKNSSGNMAKDSGVIPSGQSIFVWNDAPAGNYTVALGYGLVELTPYKSFRVDRKAIPTSVSFNCSANGYPNNVTVTHRWTPAQGSFSSQYLEISTNKNFTNIQTKLISNSASAAVIDGYSQRTNYYWRVKSSPSAGGVLYSRIQGFATGYCPDPIPQTPTPTSVSGLPSCVIQGQKYGENITLNWTSVSNATVYNIHFTFDHPTNGDYATKSSNTNNSGGRAGWDNGGNTRVVWVNNSNLSLDANTTYYFAVEALNGDASSGFDLVGKSFKVGPVANCVNADVDTDSDGFKDSAEDYMGTNKKLACGVNAWPPDLNDDSVVNSLDQLLLSKNLSSKNLPSYNKRYDLNADGSVNAGDQALQASKFGKSCKVLGVKTNGKVGQVLGISTPGVLRVGKPDCSDVPYWVYLGWDNPGDFWIDMTWNDWASFYNKHVTSGTFTGAPGDFGNNGNPTPYFVLFPGRTYKWRIWNGSGYTYGPDFLVTNCSNGIGAGYDEIRSYMYAVGSNITVLGGNELKSVLWGLAGCETGRTWNPSAGSGGAYVGLFQYDTGTWNTRLAENGLPANSISREDAFKQIEFTAKFIRDNQWLGPWGDYCANHWSDQINLYNQP